MRIQPWFLVLAFLTACTSPPESTGGRLQVVATTGIIGDVVDNIGGDAIDLSVLMGPGQDPHSYEPSARDLARMERADIIFVNGFDLEESALAVIEPLAGEVRVVEVSEGIVPRQWGEGRSTEEHGHEAGDPHVWMDPANVIIWVNNIASNLSEADPAHGDTYRRNAEAYTAQLKALDAEIASAIDSIPDERRRLVTHHDSFGYLADRYGLTVIGVVLPGGGTDAEPSARQMAALVETIRAQEIPVIFVESNVSDATARTIAGEVGGGVHVLTLYSGSLGAPGSGAETYLDMMRLNVETIRNGLSG